MRVAENTTQAIEMTRRALPDLIISDIRMPGEDGYEFLNMLKVCVSRFICMRVCMRQHILRFMQLRNHTPLLSLHARMCIPHA
jgi:CheY-like chemotaxis protein